MTNSQEATAKPTNSQLNKLKSAAKNKIGTILRINKKNFQDKELPYELFLTTKQTTKVRNVFFNNISIDIKLSKAQMSEKVQSGRFLSGNLGKNIKVDLPIPLPRDNLPGLARNLASNAINKFERKISEKGAVRAGKGFIIFIVNEDMNDIIKIIKSLEDSNVLIESITESLKYETKKQEGKFLPALLAPLAASLVQPVISSEVKGISR